MVQRKGPPCTKTLLQLHMDPRGGVSFLALLSGTPMPPIPQPAA